MNNNRTGQSQQALQCNFRDYTNELTDPTPIAIWRLPNFIMFVSDQSPRWFERSNVISFSLSVCPKWNPLPGAEL